VSGVVVVGPPRADPGAVARLGELGVATVHEAMGRRGLFPSAIRPAFPGHRVAGTAVTVESWPGDNLMIHVAVEQCRPGDLLVVTTTSPSTDGSFGELFATALQLRGVVGLVSTAGVRDVAALRAMGFPVWSAAVSAQGTVKATAGNVNCAVAVGGVVIHPGDVVLCDEDGVVRVPRAEAAAVAAVAEARAGREAQTRDAFRAGEIGLDRYGLRELVQRLGVTYRSSDGEVLDQGATPAQTLG
jgi:4-hydroxy-4-methyl-2-oxoglutarate aldolase